MISRRYAAVAAANGEDSRAALAALAQISAANDHLERNPNLLLLLQSLYLRLPRLR